MRAAFALIPLLLAACATPSKHHLGFFRAADGVQRFDMASRKSLRGLDDLEERWIRLIIKGDLVNLAPWMAPALEAMMTPAVLEKASYRIKAYGLSDAPHDHKLEWFGAPAWSRRPGVKADAYEYYDMVGTSYRIEGKVESTLRLYTTKVDGEIRLCGFELYPFTEGLREPGKDIRFVAPEHDRGAGRVALPPADAPPFPLHTR